MVGMVQGGVIAQINEFYDFVKLLSDKDATLALLQQFRDAAADQDAKTAAAAQAAKTAEARLAELAEREKVLAALETNAKTVTLGQGVQAQDLAAREAQLIAATQELEKQRTEILGMKQAHEAEFAEATSAHARHVSAAQKDLDDKAQEAAAREAAVTEREKAVETAAAEYAAKLAALKQIAG